MYETFRFVGGGERGDIGDLGEPGERGDRGERSSVGDRGGKTSSACKNTDIFRNRRMLVSGVCCGRGERGLLGLFGSNRVVWWAR